MAGSISTEVSMSIYGEMTASSSSSSPIPKAKVTAHIATAITFVAAMVGSIALGILTGGIALGVFAAIGGVLLTCGAGALFSKIACIFEGAKTAKEAAQ
jgi:hypothetical protein